MKKKKNRPSDWSNFIKYEEWTKCSEVLDFPLSLEWSVKSRGGQTPDCGGGERDTGEELTGWWFHFSYQLVKQRVLLKSDEPLHSRTGSASAAYEKTEFY